MAGSDWRILYFFSSEEPVMKNWMRYTVGALGGAALSFVLTVRAAEPPNCTDQLRNVKAQLALVENKLDNIYTLVAGLYARCR